MTSKATKSIFFNSLTYFKTLPEPMARLPAPFHTLFEQLSQTRLKLRQHPLLLCPVTAERLLRRIPPHDLRGRMVVENNAGLGLLSHVAAQLVARRAPADELADALAQVTSWTLVETYPFLHAHLAQHVAGLAHVWPGMELSTQSHMADDYYDSLAAYCVQKWAQRTAPPITYFMTYSYKHGNVALLQDFLWMGSKAGIFKFGEFPIYATLPRRYTETLLAKPGDMDRTRVSALSQIVCRMEVLDTAEPLTYAPFKSEMDLIRITPVPEPMYKGHFAELDAVIGKLYLRPKRELRDALVLIDPTSKLAKEIPQETLRTPVFELTSEALCDLAQLISEWPLKRDFLLLD